MNGRVNFVDSVRDRKVLHLAAIGRPMGYIAMATGLTVAQVSYRLSRRAGMKLKEIRSGTDKYHLGRVVEGNLTVMREVAKSVDHMLGAERVIINGAMNHAIDRSTPGRRNAAKTRTTGIQNGNRRH